MINKMLKIAVLNLLLVLTACATEKSADMISQKNPGTPVKNKPVKEVDRGILEYYNFFDVNERACWFLPELEIYVRLKSKPTERIYYYLSDEEIKTIRELLAVSKVEKNCIFTDSGASVGFSLKRLTLTMDLYQVPGTGGGFAVGNQSYMIYNKKLNQYIYQIIKTKVVEQYSDTPETRGLLARLKKHFDI